MTINIFPVIDIFDLIIILGYLGLVIANGIYASKRVHNIEDFATGGKSYSSFIVFATLSASFIGGGFTSGLAEKTFIFGLIYVIGLWGFSLKELLIAKFIAPQMGKFKTAQSVGDIMGQLYGEKAKIFTGIASFLVCSGIIGAQFTALGYMTNILLGMDFTLSTIIGACIIMTYTGWGGMRAVVSNDTLHFSVLIVTLPLVLIMGILHIGGFNVFTNTVVKTFSFNISWSTLFLVFLSFFFGETLVPPYVQRLLIGKDIESTVKGNWWSGLLSIPFFLMIGCIGVVALALNSTLNPNLALPFVILETMPIGLKGLAVAGIIAVIMSSADSFLNAASVAVSHDILDPLFGNKLHYKKLKISRITTYVIGLAGLIFSLQLESSLDILLQSYVFWTPIIIVPFVAGILNIVRPASTFWISSFVGVITVCILQFLRVGHNEFFEVSVWGVLMNMVTFFSVKKPLKLPFISFNKVRKV
jgi:SSS family solute:Na+ symporter